MSSLDEKRLNRLYGLLKKEQNPDNAAALLALSKAGLLGKLREEAQHENHMETR